jgi:hypothetical protein
MPREGNTFQPPIGKYRTFLEAAVEELIERLVLRERLLDLVDIDVVQRNKPAA